MSLIFHIAIGYCLGRALGNAIVLFVESLSQLNEKGDDQ